MTADTPIDISSLITSTPGVQGGQPCIVGTRIRVRQVAAMHRDGMSVEAIAEEYPHVPVSHLHAAVAYYLVNRERIDAEIDDEAALYERLAREHANPTP